MRIRLLLLLGFLPVALLGQPARQTQAGAALSFELEKGLYRFLSLGVEEEVRLQNNPVGFDRNVISAGLNYDLFGSRMKIGAYYAFIYLYNNDHFFEPRHRFYVNLSYKQNLESLFDQWNISAPINLSWRLRLQETLRDEDRGSYRVNPRYVMKNKFEAEYLIWGSPWKPYLSCDLSTNLNDHETRYDFVRLRFQGGVSWRLNRTDYLNFFIRWDEYLKEDDPRVISPGISYKIKF